MPKIDIREKFTRTEITIEAGAVETFCAVVGNQSDENFKILQNSEMKAPMDFAIVTSWQVSLLINIFL